MRVLGLLCGVLLVAPRPASATYSIVFADSESVTVGGAGTSCVGALDVRIIHRSVPGKGAVHAQARINTDARDEAVRLIAMDTAPADIITQITGAGFDGMSAQRQYAVVDLMGRSAAFTGSQNGSVAAHRSGRIAQSVYSVQGNILTSELVLEQSERAFRNENQQQGCDLPERLLLALEAGSENGQGDSRCTIGGIPADSAFIQVIAQDGTAVIDLSVTDTGPQSPLPLLRQEFEAWRVTHPCPTRVAIDAGSPPDAGAGQRSKGCVTTGSGAAKRFGLVVVLLLLLRRRS